MLASQIAAFTIASGTFSILKGWVTSSSGGNRCSGYSLQPVVTSAASNNGLSAEPAPR